MKVTKSFDEKSLAKSRAKCAEMAEAASTGKRVLTERERQILAMWPRFEDGEPVWFGDAVEAHHGGAITIEAIEFSRGKVCVKDAEDGDWDTSMYAMHPLKRPSPGVLDADGVEIKIGDTVYDTKGEGRIVKEVYFDDDEFHEHIFWCGEYKFGYRFVYVADQLTHTRPDSWKRLEMEAESIVKSIAWHLGDYSPSCYKRSGDSIQDRVLALVRRAKALAGVEAER